MHLLVSLRASERALRVNGRPAPRMPRLQLVRGGCAPYAAMAHALPAACRLVFDLSERGGRIRIRLVPEVRPPARRKGTVEYPYELLPLMGHGGTAQTGRCHTRPRGARGAHAVGDAAIPLVLRGLGGMPRVAACGGCCMLNLRAARVAPLHVCTGCNDKPRTYRCRRSCARRRWRTSPTWPRGRRRLS